ncbi:MAG: galactokinase [Oscillospiraceae bacterium]|nr:galactokinase [Oscillospiraceae bacterium]
MPMRLDELGRLFVGLYGDGGGERIRCFASPGRVNLIGEHTDYNGGYVLPAALSLCSTCAVRPRADGVVRLAATDLGGAPVEARLDSLDGYRGLKWGNYQLGVADQLLKAGYALPGCDMLFHDEVPLGAGLSSSAAIEVASALAFISTARGPAGGAPAMGMPEVAKLAQRAEHEYVGVKCGIMDQFASAMGREGHAMLLDCRDLSHRHIPLSIGGHAFVIANTNKKRALSDSKYNERRAECEAGLASLKARMPGIACLGDVTVEGFEENAGAIADGVVRRRVRHVVHESRRVLDSVRALGFGNPTGFGRLMVASHESLKADYEVTGMELDALVEAALAQKGVLGSRMTGAGFGGCTVSLVREADVEAFIEGAGSMYEKKVGYAATFYRCATGDGGRELA